MNADPPPSLASRMTARCLDEEFSSHDSRLRSNKDQSMFVRLDFFFFGLIQQSLWQKHTLTVKDPQLKE